MRRVRFQLLERRDLLAIDLIDVNTTPQSSAPTDFVVADETVYFKADLRGSTGLFQTDGQSVTPVEAIPQPKHIIPTPFGEFSVSQVSESIEGVTTTRFILARIALTGEETELFHFGTSVEDGEESSTTGNVAAKILLPTIANDRLYFFSREVFPTSSSQSDGLTDLIVTDGTVTGTKQLEASADRFSEMVAVNEQVFMIGWDSQSSRRLAEIWQVRPDDTIEKMSSTGQASQLTVVGDDLVFNRGRALRKLVVDGPDQSLASSITSSLNLLFGEDDFFYFSTPNEGKLWYSDKTREGTREVELLGERFDGPIVAFEEGVIFSSADPLLNGDSTFRLRRFHPTDGIANLGELPELADSFHFVDDQLLIVSGNSLWTTDGTKAGTAAIPNVSVHSDLFELGRSQFVFQGAGPDGDRELWKTDGTTLGTQLIQNLVEGTESLRLRRVRTGDTRFPNVAKNDGGVRILTLDGLFQVSENHDHPQFLGDLYQEDTFGAHQDTWIANPKITSDTEVFFIARERSRSIKKELWVEKPNGELGIAWQATGDGRELSQAANFIEKDGIIYFYMDRTAHPQFWRTDGTQAGTQLVHELNTVDYRNRDFVLYPGGLLVARSGRGVNELISIDAETHNVTVLAKLPDIDVEFAVVGNRVLFHSDDILFSTDGTPENTIALGAFERIRVTEEADSRAFYTTIEDSRPVLWESDGTLEGTAKVPFSQLSPLQRIGDANFFVATTPAGETFVWRIENGTLDQAIPILALESGLSLTFHLVDQRLFISTQNSLYESDGTADGTRFLGTFDGKIRDIAKIGNVIVFRSRDSLFRISDDQMPQLFATMDGVPTESHLALDKYFFVVGNRIWVSNGTTDGTFILSEGIDVQNDSEFSEFGNRLYFTGHSEEFGTELWSTDGTQRGVRLEADFFPGQPSSSPTDMVVTENALFVIATDETHGREVWRITPAEIDAAVADFNGNGLVDFADFLVLSTNFGSTNATEETGDLDGNQQVDFNDFLLFSSVFGERTAEEPVS